MDTAVQEFTETQLAIRQAEGQIAQIEEKISGELKTHREHLKELQRREQYLRDALKAGMELNGVKKFENDVVAITYVAPSVRTTFDSTRFKKEQPDIYSQYTKQSDVSASIRIKVKETN